MPIPPRPPHERSPHERPPHREEIVHEDLADLIEAKFERVFRELDDIKRRLG